jgi:hypothetical protein
MNSRSLLHSIPLALALGAVSLSAFAAEEATVKSVAVAAEIDTAVDANALSLYPEMERDLERAILDRIPVEDDPNGYVVQVALQMVALDGDTYLPDTMEFNQMEGTVLITSPLTDAAPQSIPVRIMASTAETAAPEGFVMVNPDPADFYMAMLMAFADTVAEQIPETMPEDASK